MKKYQRGYFDISGTDILVFLMLVAAFGYGAGKVLERCWNGFGLL
jgi:hypothetical protein